MFGYTFPQIRKSVLGFIAFVLMAVAASLPVGNSWKALIEAVLGLAATYGVFRVPNEPLPLIGTESHEDIPSYPSNVNVRRNTTDL